MPTARRPRYGPIPRRLRARDPVLVSLFRRLGIPYAQGMGALVAKLQAGLEAYATQHRASEQARRRRYATQRARRHRRRAA